MTTNTQKDDQLNQTERPTPFFEAQLPPGELERILSRIEENLATRQIIEEPSRKRTISTTPLPPIPSLSSLEAKLAQLQASKAPLFRPEERDGWSALVRRILNFPIRLFGYKQTQFNNDLLALLAEMTLLFHQTLTEQQRALLTTRLELEKLAEQQQQLEAKLFGANHQPDQSSLKPSPGAESQHR